MPERLSFSALLRRRLTFRLRLLAIEVDHTLLSARQGHQGVILVVVFCWLLFYVPVSLRFQ